MSCYLLVFKILNTYKINMSFQAFFDPIIDNIEIGKSRGLHLCESVSQQNNPNTSAEWKIGFGHGHKFFNN